MVVKPFFQDFSWIGLNSSYLEFRVYRLQRRIFRTSGRELKLKTFGVQSFMGR